MLWTPLRTERRLRALIALVVGLTVALLLTPHRDASAGSGGSGPRARVSAAVRA